MRDPEAVAAWLREIPDQNLNIYEWIANGNPVMGNGGLYEISGVP